VRHNEDTLNAELAQGVMWGVDASSLDSPHTKAFLLLQACGRACTVIYCTVVYCAVMYHADLVLLQARYVAVRQPFGLVSRARPVGD